MFCTDKVKCLCACESEWTVHAYTKAETALAGLLCDATGYVSANLLSEDEVLYPACVQRKKSHHASSIMARCWICIAENNSVFAYAKTCPNKLNFRRTLR